MNKGDIESCLLFTPGTFSYETIDFQQEFTEVPFQDRSYRRWYQHWEMQKLSGHQLKRTQCLNQIMYIKALDQPRKYTLYLLK